MDRGGGGRREAARRERKGSHGSKFYPEYCRTNFRLLLKFSLSARKMRSFRHEAIKFRLSASKGDMLLTILMYNRS